MLTAKKKIAVREPIQESTIATKWVEFQMYFQENAKMITGLGIAIVAVVVFGYIYITNKNADNVEATIQLANILPLFEQQQYKLAIEGDPSRRIVGLKDIASSYSGTKAANTTYLYLGDSYLYLGEYDNAIAAFHEANPDGDILKAGVLSGLANAYEAKKEYLKAAKNFEKAGNTFKDDAISSDRFVQAARNYALAGEKEKARKLYKTVKIEYKAPRYSRDIDRYIAELGLDEK